MSARRVMLVSAVGTIGGGEEVLLALVRHLPEFGYVAEVVCLRPGPLAAAAEAAGATFVAQGEAHRMRDIRRVRATQKWLAGLIADRRPAVVHCNHMAHLYGHGPARRGGAKEVWHIHDFPHRFDWADRLCRLLPADGVIFTTPFVTSGYPLVRRRFVNRIIAPAPPVMPPAVEGDIRTRLGLPASRPILITATRLQPHKGHPVLLDAVARVKVDVPSVLCIVTGEPADDNQRAYLANLKSQVAALAIDDNLRFVGRISDSELAALYSTAVALVHPALTEGFGLALVNAMRSGLAVIAADAEGPKFVLDEGRLGTLVPRRDAAAFADAILRHLKRPPDGRELRRISEIADARFSAAKMARDVAALYDDLL